MSRTKLAEATLLKLHSLTLRPGQYLSESYANDRNSIRIVDTHRVVAYQISGGGRGAAAYVRPCYETTTYTRDGKSLAVAYGIEAGDALNEPTFHLDYLGCTLATIAHQAVQALEERAFAANNAPKPKKSKK